MSQKQPGDDGSPPSLDPLDRKQRIVLGLFGATAFALGTTATFVTSNDVGTGMLLALGGLFLLIAVTGNPITRARMGDNEVTFGLRRVVAQVLESPEPEVQESAAEAVLDGSLPPSDPLRRQAELIESGLAYERRVWVALSRLFADDNVQQTGGVSDRGIDMQVLYRQRRIGIQVKMTASRRRLPRPAIKQAVAALSLVGTPAYPLDGLVIVCNHAAPDDYEEVRRHPRLGLAVWNSEADDAVLGDEVERVASISE